MAIHLILLPSSLSFCYPHALQVQQSLEARAAAAATVVAPIVAPPVPFVGPGMVSSKAFG